MTSSEASAADVRSFDVLHFFEALAKATGAAGALPSKDGCVLFAFVSGSRRWRVFWSPVERPGGFRVPDLPGCLVVKGQARVSDIETLGKRLVVARTRSGSGALDPLFVPPRAAKTVELSPRMFELHMPRFLEPGTTCWGTFLFESVRQGRGWLDLRWVSPNAEVVLALRPKPPLDESGYGGSSFRLHASYDTRSLEEARSVGGAVENYLSYALSRAFPPSQVFAIPEEDGSFSVHDLHDETPPDRFFLGEEHRRISCQHTFSTLLEADQGVGFVLHTTAECASHYAWIKSSKPYGHLHARPAVLPMAFPAKQAEFVEVGEMDAVMGAEQELRDGIRRIASHPDTEVVVTCGTCISHLLNIPVDALLEEEAGTKGLPSSFLEFVVDDTARPEQVWVDLLRIADREAVPKARHVNLVGYAAADSDLVQEAEPLLRTGGLSVVGWLVPSFRTQPAKRFGEACTTFVSTAAIAADEFIDARKAWPRMPFVDLAPPYGLEGTRSFYRHIIRRAGGTSCAAVDAAFENLLPSWEKWRLRAKVHSIGFLVHPDEACHLTNPSSTHGANLIPLLAEMGFRIVVHCAGGAESAQAERACDDLRRRFSDLVRDGNLLVDVAKAPGVRAIEHLNASLVFSEHPSDQRVLAVGRMPVGTGDLEPGYAGALRTQMKFVRLAESRFFRTFEQARKPRPPCD